MREDANDFREPVRLQNIEELERFLAKALAQSRSAAVGVVTHHLKPIRSINHKQHEVSNFANVDHRINIVIAFDEGDAFLLPADNCYWPLNLVERLLRISPD